MFVEMNYSCDLSWVTKEGKWRPVSSRDHKSWISRANWFRVAEIVIVLWSSQFSLFLNWNCSKGSPQSETRPIVLHDFHGARWRTIRSNDQSWQIVLDRDRRNRYLDDLKFCNCINENIYYVLFSLISIIY